MPKPARRSYTRAASPAFTTPWSVTTRGRFIPRRATWSGRRASAPGPRTMRVGQDISVMIGETGRSKGVIVPSLRKAGERLSDELQVAFELPGGHRPLELAHLPLARADEVIDEALAEELPGPLGAPQELQRVLEAAGQRPRPGVGVPVPGAGTRGLDALLHPPQPGGEGDGHADVRVHVGAELAVLDPHRLGIAADDPDGAGAVLPSPGGGGGRPGVLDAALV